MSTKSKHVNSLQHLYCIAFSDSLCLAFSTMGNATEECCKCKKKILARKNRGLQCNGTCKLYYCQPCAKISNESFDTLRSDPANLSWICPTCKGRRKSIICGLDTSQSIPSSAPSGSKQHIAGKSSNNNENVTAIAECRDFLTSKIEELNSVLEEIRNDNKVLRNRVDNLERKFTTLESIVYELEANADLSKRKALEKNLILKGIPASPNEDAVKIVKDVSAKMGLNIPNESIVRAVRINNKSGSTKFVALLVSFVDSSTKSSLVDVFRQRQNVMLYDVLEQFRRNSVHQNTRISIRDDLTKLQRDIFIQSKNAQAELNLKFAWMKNGEVFVRKTENSKVHKISSRFDLIKVYELYSHGN